MIRRYDNSETTVERDLHRGVGCHKQGSMSYFWLAYSLFFLLEPFLRHNLRYWLEQIPPFVIFLGLYIAYTEIPRRKVRLWCLAAMYVLGVVTLPTNPGGSSFLIYVAALLPFCLESSAVFIAVLAAEVLTFAVEWHFLGGYTINYIITGFFTVVVGVSNLFVAQQKRADARLRRAEADNVALAAVAERERIARDLHDVLGHTLSVIVLKAELAGRLIERDPARAQSEIGDVERTARTALAEVREAIGGYRSKGLNAEVEQARVTLDAAGVALVCETRPPALPAREETVLSLAVREAVTNIVRHAQATQCTMRFATAPDGFASFEVADNGNAKLEREGNGLRGMRERVQELGGRFRIDSSDGTRLVIELPRTAAGSVEG
jgi:two-component system sensor histidine kinase DesK